MYTDLALHIDGQWLNGDGRAGEEVINPATEKPLARASARQQGRSRPRAGGRQKGLRGLAQHHPL